LWGRHRRGDAEPGSGQDDEVERLSSLTVTEVPRSELRDVDEEVSNAERAEELHVDLGVEEGDGEAQMEVPGDVLFGFDEVRVRNRAFPLLADVAELIELTEPSLVRVEGHTDSIGAPAYNRDLSERRAEAVVECSSRSTTSTSTRGCLRRPASARIARLSRTRPRTVRTTRRAATARGGPAVTPPRPRAKNRRVEVVLDDRS
jgi:outer membrane protein OmpA-like peptidoglycan-associated protein